MLASIIGSLIPEPCLTHPSSPSPEVTQTAAQVLWNILSAISLCGQQGMDEPIGLRMASQNCQVPCPGKAITQQKWWCLTLDTPTWHQSLRGLGAWASAQGSQQVSGYRSMGAIGKAFLQVLFLHGPSSLGLVPEWRPHGLHLENQQIQTPGEAG